GGSDGTFFTRGLGESHLSDRIRGDTVHRRVPRSEPRQAYVGANRCSDAGGAKIQTERCRVVHTRGGRNRHLCSVLRVRTGGLFSRWARALAPAARAVHATTWNGEFAGAGRGRGDCRSRSGKRLVHRRV